MRIVRAPDGVVALDPTGRAAGRGAYLCADGACWATALKRGAVQRALRVALPAEVEARLREEAATRSAVAVPNEDSHQPVIETEGERLGP